MTIELLFVQGGGEDVHDGWDNRLVDSLGRALGDGYEIRYPRMPDEGDPTYASWAPALRRELAGLKDGAIVVGHSIGATVLVHVIAEERPSVTLGGIFLVAAPFVGEGGWPSDEIAARPDLGARLPKGVPVFLYRGSADDTVPLEHIELYAAGIPQAVARRLAGRDHQLHDDMSEVAADIRGLR